MTPLTEALLRWYGKNRILYPWRKTKDPYKIWLSEILLQQTRIPVVLKYYEKILLRFPQLSDLTKGRDAEFLALWSGLGYYKRAHSMLACAGAVMDKYKGKFPSGLDELLALPGIGKYTAGALRNVCFNKLTPALDGNIRRVLSRLATEHHDLEDFFLKIGKGADPGEFFQSLMELGEQVCLPDPQCPICPVSCFCKAKQKGKIADFPKARTKKRIEIFHWYLLMAESDGAHYYVQNSSRDFLKHSWIFPDILSTRELDIPALRKKFLSLWGIQADGLREHKTVSHAVTYRRIRAHIFIADSLELNGCEGKWLSESDFRHHPTSSITRKVLQIQNG